MAKSTHSASQASSAGALTPVSPCVIVKVNGSLVVLSRPCYPVETGRKRKTTEYSVLVQVFSLVASFLVRIMQGGVFNGECGSALANGNLFPSQVGGFVDYATGLGQMLTYSGRYQVQESTAVRLQSRHSAYT